MVLSAIVHAILADVVSEGRRAQAFFYLASTQLVSEVIAPLLGSSLMKSGVYAPLILGFPLQTVSIAFAWMIPSSTRRQKDGDEREYAHETGAQEDQATTFFSRLKSLGRLVQAQAGVIMVGVSFLSSMLAGESLDYMVQYASKTLDWSLAEVCMLVFDQQARANS